MSRYYAMSSMASAIAAVKKLGVDAVKKLMGLLKNSLPDLDQGTRSRFAKAIMSIALASGALMAQGCVGTMTIDIGDVSYREYRRRPQVVHVVRAGFHERDVRRVYHVQKGGGGRDPNRGPDRRHRNRRHRNR